MIFVYDMSVQVVRTNTNKINDIVKTTVKIQRTIDFILRAIIVISTHPVRFYES